MSVIEASYEGGVLKPSRVPALREGEHVNLIVVRRGDSRRWDLQRLAESGTAEDEGLAEQGLAEWSDRLDVEDGH